MNSEQLLLMSNNKLEGLRKQDAGKTKLVSVAIQS